MFAYSTSAKGTVTGSNAAKDLLETYSFAGTTPLSLGFQVVVGGSNTNFSDSYYSGGPYSIAIKDLYSGATQVGANMIITAETQYEQSTNPVVHATTILTFTSSSYTGAALPSTTTLLDTFTTTRGHSRLGPWAIQHLCFNFA